MTKNPYEVLGIPQGSSVEDAKKAYRRLARKYHPDVSDDPNAEERFKEVQAAWDAIKNPQPQRPAGGFGGGDPFSEIFRNFGFGFGQGPDGVHVRTVRTMQLNISLEESYRGTTRNVNGAQVNLPPGVRSGTRFSLNNDEMRLVIAVNPHPRFERNNDDLLIRTAISWTQAILGCQIRVTHLDGRKLDVKIPGGVQNGQTVRLSGQGMPNPQWRDRRGDLFVQVAIRMPDPNSLTDEQKQFLKTLNHEEIVNV